ncbi:MAG: ferredoxin [Intrasporangium sp.]|uniref:ferredoxin n=1 Tax=Intrasporangium sp. TaxID=1925024 RepID=UPI00264823A8|nr:ferredoxin [Intrasporangium sp.]MDN5796414.1 ferredoxin [Intrasporangium sp.]
MSTTTTGLKVTVDPTRCQAYGLCVGLSPDVFDIPPGSPVAVVRRDIVDGDDLADVEEAVRNCPAQAISITEVP